MLSNSQSQSQQFPTEADSQTQPQNQLHDPNSLPPTANAFALPAKPANPRRKAAPAFTRPTTLAAIRTTLSELIGEPDPLTSAALGNNAAELSDSDEKHGSDDERVSHEEDELEHRDKYEPEQAERHDTDNEAGDQEARGS